MLYVRGCRGLHEAIDEVNEKTGGMIEYVGEWHSHPPRVGTDASTNDFQVFEWLHTLMESEGLPPVMIIVGDQVMTRCFIDDIEKNQLLEHS